ncbi:hypothetical protein B0H14DRAFT_2806460 [Mycena olivaceomarginata]|nr:hypothetical protein B0H14DRAFT_2806460 [Mycena olivaceomarginata]
MADGTNLEMVHGEGVTDQKVDGPNISVGPEAKLTTVFVNNLPSNIDNQGLTFGFVMYGISIHSAAIRCAWRKRWCIAEVVVAEADHVKTLALNGKLVFGRNIIVKPFMPKRLPQAKPQSYGERPQNTSCEEELRSSVIVTGVEWSVLQLSRILQSQGMIPGGGPLEGLKHG